MRLIKILGFSHIVIALGAGVTVYLSGVVLGLEGAFLEAALLVGALTGLGYTTQRLIKTMFFPTSAFAERNAYMKRYGVGLFIVWGAIVVSAFSFGLMYAWFPFRETPYLKLPLTSLVWAIATVILPVYLTGLEHVIEMNTVCTIVLARGLYIAGLTIPFDVRDLDIDRLDMKTLPQTIGVASSLYWAMILVGSSAALWFGLAASQSINEYVGIALGIHAIVTISFVSPYFAGINRHEIYHTIVLDGLLIVQIFALPISARCFI
jgi:hypothetical protein